VRKNRAFPRGPCGENRQVLNPAAHGQIISCVLLSPFDFFLRSERIVFADLRRPVKGAGHVDFEECIHLEHCDSLDSDVLFKSGNYLIETTPRQEWTYVSTPDKYPPEQMNEGRNIKIVDTLMLEETSKKAKLIKAEVIAVVLYTGPMVFTGFPRSFVVVWGWEDENLCYFFNACC
jgi:hypothetical protein